MPDEGLHAARLARPFVAGETPLVRRRLVLAACLMATFMAAVESTIIATAMPTIVAELGGFSLFSWVFAVYLLTQAGSIPVYGRLADIYGRKQVFYVGAGLFLVGSALCGFANNMIVLILFRAVQGLGAGGVQPIATTILGDIYAPTERAHVQGLVSSVFGVAAVLGPSLGAFLVEQVSWQLVFWVNLPIGVAAIVMVAAFLDEPVEHRPAPDRLSGFAAADGCDRRADARAGAGRQPAAAPRRSSAHRHRRAGDLARARDGARRSRCCRWSSGATGSSSLAAWAAR